MKIDYYKMKIIFISGPSGSGKTTLSNEIIMKIKDGVVMSTDNYYKTGLVSNLLSKFVEGYFDRNISFDYKLFKKDFYFILNNKKSMYRRSYDFENKRIKKSYQKSNNINFLIVEGIFAKEFSSTLNNQNNFFLELKINKNECMKRVLQRDVKERAKPKNKALNDFIKSWDIYYDKFKDKGTQYKKNEFDITKNTNIDKILEKIF